MKKSGCLILAIWIVCSGSSLAQEGVEPEPQQEQGGMMMGGPGGKAKMMGMMQNDSLVATSDGGVVLKQGPRLIKYDAGMNLVKEVEIPRGKKPSSAEQTVLEVPAV